MAEDSQRRGARRQGGGNKPRRPAFALHFLLPLAPFPLVKQPSTFPCWRASNFNLAQMEFPAITSVYYILKRTIDLSRECNAMPEHMSEAQWEAFWAKTLPIPVMVEAAKHHSDCDQCRAIAHEVFMRRRNYAPIVIDLSDETWFKDDHLDMYETDLVVAYVEGTLDEDDRGWIESHLRTCDSCLGMIRQTAENRRRSRLQHGAQASDS